MIAPLCALILIGVALLRDDFLKDLVEGPAVVLATSTAVGPASGAAPNASPSALISDAVSPPVTPGLQAGAEGYPMDTAPATQASSAATATNVASTSPAPTAAAPTAAAPTQPAQPTVTAVANATAIPATPTPFGADTATPPTVTPTLAVVVGPTETPGPDGWWFRSVKVAPILVNEESHLYLMAELVNTTTQNQAITSISADITFTDGTTVSYSGDDLFWPTRDVDFSVGLPPQGQLPVEIFSFDGPDGASVKSIAWHVKSTPGGAIGRTDFQLTTVWSGMRSGQYCVDYRLLIPGNAPTDAVIVSMWGKNHAGEVVGIEYSFGNAFFEAPGVAIRKPICFTPLTGETVETQVIAVWGQ